MADYVASLHFYIIMFQCPTYKTTKFDLNINLTFFPKRRLDEEHVHVVYTVIVIEQTYISYTSAHAVKSGFFYYYRLLVINHAYS